MPKFTWIIYKISIHLFKQNVISPNNFWLVQLSWYLLSLNKISGVWIYESKKLVQ